MQRHQARQAQVVPIMLRPCDYTGEVFSKLQGLPTGMKAITTWPNQDEAWTDVVKGLALLFDKFREEREGAAKSSGAVALTGQPPASSPDRGPFPAPHEIVSIAPGGESGPDGTSTKAFQSLSELMSNAKINAFVAEQQAIGDGQEALEVLVDYKTCTSISIVTCSSSATTILSGSTGGRRSDRLVLACAAAGPGGTFQSLEEAANRRSMADEDFYWLAPTARSAGATQRGVRPAQLPPLRLAGRDHHDPSDAPDDFRYETVRRGSHLAALEHLQKALYAVRGKLARLVSIRGGSGFERGRHALPQLSANLQALTTEHTRWQVIETRIWSIDALIDRDLGALQMAGRKCAIACQNLHGDRAPWARSILNRRPSSTPVVEARPVGIRRRIPALANARASELYKSLEQGRNPFFRWTFPSSVCVTNYRAVQQALVKMLQKLP